MRVLVVHCHPVPESFCAALRDTAIDALKKAGEAQITGRYLPQSQGRAALRENDAQFIEKDPRGPSLEDRCPEQVAALRAAGELMRPRLREELPIEFTLLDGQLTMLTRLLWRAYLQDHPGRRVPVKTRGKGTVVGDPHGVFAQFDFAAGRYFAPNQATLNQAAVKLHSGASVCKRCQQHCQQARYPTLANYAAAHRLSHHYKDP